MAGNKSVKIDPAEVERAQHVWAGFTLLLKASVIASVAVLALLGIAFIDW